MIDVVAREEMAAKREPGALALLQVLEGQGVARMGDAAAGKEGFRPSGDYSLANSIFAMVQELSKQALRVPFGYAEMSSDAVVSTAISATTSSRQRSSRAPALWANPASASYCAK